MPNSMPKSQLKKPTIIEIRMQKKSETICSCIEPLVKQKRSRQNRKTQFPALGFRHLSYPATSRGSASESLTLSEIKTHT